MCGECGPRRPPEVICAPCKEVNDGCVGYCRDAFVYDPSRSEEEIVEELRQSYIIGGLGGSLEFLLKLPANIEALVSVPPGPGDMLRKLVNDLVENAWMWIGFHGKDGQKPIVGGQPIEVDMDGQRVSRLAYHVEGKQHVYVEISPNGDISLTLSLPTEGDTHELLLRRGQAPVYHHDPSQFSAGFPEARFEAWLREAIEASELR